VGNNISEMFWQVKRTTEFLFNGISFKFTVNRMTSARFVTELFYETATYMGLPA
jgi:hypothetical protein